MIVRAGTGVVLFGLLLTACGDNGATDGVTVDAAVAAPDAAGTSCVEAGEPVDEWVPAGDDCNFCLCEPSGRRTCTTRTCALNRGGCDYDGVEHAFAERFPSTDGCNECTCAMSGLACTRRTCDGALEEGAILMESLDEVCGDDPAFTPATVLADLPVDDIPADFLYQRDRPPEQYPEELPDTKSVFRVRYDGGFAVCRIPNPGFESIDFEVVSEFTTADGSFNEGFHTAMTKDRTGFVDAWYINSVVPFGELQGSYDYLCTLDPGAARFTAQIDRSGVAFGSAIKVCETDLSLAVGNWQYGFE